MQCHRYPRGLALLAALAIISPAPPAAAQPVGKVPQSLLLRADTLIE